MPSEISRQRQILHDLTNMWNPKNQLTQTQIGGCQKSGKEWAKQVKVVKGYKYPVMK